MAFALYSQHVLGLDPCPLCIFQRVAVVGLGVLFLIAAIHSPGRLGCWIYAVLLVAVSLVRQADVMLDPGAKRSTQVPTLEKDDRASLLVVEPTVTPVGVEAGEKLQALALLLPADNE